MSYFSSEGVPEFIHFSGVHIDVLRAIDKRMEAKILQTEEDMIDKIPAVFRGFDSWIKSSNVFCWGCHCKGIIQPMFLPTHIDINGAEIGVEGLMHGYKCIMLYVEKTYLDEEIRRRKIESVRYLFRLKYKKWLKTISCAEPVYSMKKYGGHLSEEEWLARNKDDLSASNLADDISSIVGY